MAGNNKARGFFGEFQAFIARGNVLDLAVGVIIGGAFQKIVTSVVNDLIMPLVGLVTGGVNFNDQFVVLKLPEGVTATQVTSLQVAKDLGVTTFNYGAFVTAVIDFLKAFNKMKDGTAKLPFMKNAKGEEVIEHAPTCPFCLEEINVGATRCPHCTSQLDDIAEEAD